DPHDDRTLRAAEVGESHAEIEPRCERCAGGPDRLLRHARVLRLQLEAERPTCDGGRTEAQAAERVEVVATFGESRSGEPFHALAEFAAQLQPVRHQLVDAV